MLSRNTYLYELQAHSYADDISGELNKYGWTEATALDCALGTNPFGSALAAENAYRHTASTDDISAYPEPWSDELKVEIARYWQEAGIESTSIVIGTGSMGVLERLNTLLLFPGAHILGYAPQFADYVRSAYTHGAIYQAVPLSGPRFRFSLLDFLQHLNNELALVYIDNPNNPTGQLIPLDEIETILQRTARLSVPVIVDEAYGDFVPKKHSAMYLATKYPHLVVVRSFSKGLGLAGLRIGYAVLNHELRSLYAKLDSPFNISQAAMAASIASLRDTNFLATSCARITELKSILAGKLHLLACSFTHPSTPIITLTAPDPACNLAQAFLRQGILVVSGVDFPQLTAASVRLRIPSDYHVLLERLSAIEQVL
ncbi:MAG: aminotransferase class I/II-fold pyridoxal phosphate-dependent enzyme [bacterium]|jgi:histidinol-phosphate aminotransferase